MMRDWTSYEYKTLRQFETIRKQVDFILKRREFYRHEDNLKASPDSTFVLYTRACFVVVHAIRVQTPQQGCQADFMMHVRTCKSYYYIQDFKIYGNVKKYEFLCDPIGKLNCKIVDFKHIIHVNKS